VLSFLLLLFLEEEFVELKPSLYFSFSMGRDLLKPPLSFPPLLFGGVKRVPLLQPLTVRRSPPFR